LKDVRLENLQTFPDIYDVKELGELRPEKDTRLHISTVQGMVKRIMHPGDESQTVPVDWYDCVIIDECHRGYNLDQEMTDAEMKFRSEADTRTCRKSPTCTRWSLGQLSRSISWCGSWSMWTTNSAGT
jgi:hypothetical protein